MDRGRQAEICTSVESVVADLSDHVDVADEEIAQAAPPLEAPAPTECSSSGSALCLAGRTPIRCCDDVRESGNAPRARQLKRSFQFGHSSIHAMSISGIQGASEATVVPISASQQTAAGATRRPFH
jgi:hypothetical protein